MADFRLKFTLGAGILALAAGLAISAGALAQQGDQSSASRNTKKPVSEIADDRNNSVRSREIRFSRGTGKDLYAARMGETMARIEKSPGADDHTKVWVAHVDVASLPGLETIVHLKSPVACGSLGCELVIMGEIDGKQTLLLRTICETIAPLAQNKLVLNQGSKYEMLWVFDGAKFVHQN